MSEVRIPAGLDSLIGPKPMLLQRLDPYYKIVSRFSRVSRDRPHRVRSGL